MDLHEHASAIPFRVRIGVTGHRKLENPAELSQRVSAILAGGYREAFTPRARADLAAARATPTVFTVISPLAEGADRLVARVVLEHPASLLEVLLPFPSQDYEKDFTSDDSRLEFATFLEKAHRVTVLEAPPPADPSPASAVGGRFGRVGERVVEECDLLIALWDGERSRGRGGTAEIVELAVARGKPVFVVSTDGPEHDGLKNGGTLPAWNLTKLDQFNAYPIAATDLARYVDNAYADLYLKQDGRAGDVASAIPASRKDVVKEKLIPRYARASVIAKANQRRYQRAGRVAYLLSTLAVAAMAVAVVFRAHRAIALLAYVAELVALVTLLVMIHRAHRARVHATWLENRALAERLRTAMFFLSCGFLPGVTRRNAEGLLATDVSAWVESAFAEVRGALPRPTRPTAAECAPCGAFLRSRWIEDQLAYHRRTGEANDRRNGMLKRLGMSLFAGAIAVSVIHLGLSWLTMHGHEGGPLLRFVEDALFVVAITLPAAGAAVNGYRLLMEYSRTANRNHSVYAQLERILSAYREVSNSNELEELLAQVDDVMLLESWDWVRLMRFADLENIA